MIEHVMIVGIFAGVAAFTFYHTRVATLRGDDVWYQLGTRPPDRPALDSFERVEAFLKLPLVLCGIVTLIYGIANVSWWATVLYLAGSFIVVSIPMASLPSHLAIPGSPFRFGVLAAALLVPVLTVGLFLF